MLSVSGVTNSNVPCGQEGNERVRQVRWGGQQVRKHTAMYKGNHSKVQCHCCRAVWPNLMISLRGEGSLGFYVTLRPSHSLKPHFHKGKDFVCFILLQPQPGNNQ